MDIIHGAIFLIKPTDLCSFLIFYLSQYVLNTDKNGDKRPLCSNGFNGPTESKSVASSTSFLPTHRKEAKLRSEFLDYEGTDNLAMQPACLLTFIYSVIVVTIFAILVFK